MNKGLDAVNRLGTTVEMARSVENNGQATLFFFHFPFFFFFSGLFTCESKVKSTVTGDWEFSVTGMRRVPRDESHQLHHSKKRVKNTKMPFRGAIAPHSSPPTTTTIMLRTTILSASRSLFTKPSAVVAVRSYHPKVRAGCVCFSLPCLALPLMTDVTNNNSTFKVIDHYERPRNVGSLNKADPFVGTGLVGAPACGDVMKLQIKVDEASGKIVDVKFKTFGCGSAIASSSYMTERVRGMTLEDAGAIKNTEVAKELCLPPVKLHCSSKNDSSIVCAARFMIVSLC